MVDCLALAWDLMPSRGSNIGEFAGEHKSKASLMRGLGCSNKRMQWHRRKEYETAHAGVCVGSTRSISQVRGCMGMQV